MHIEISLLTCELVTSPNPVSRTKCRNLLMTYPSIPITIPWLRQLHYYYFGLAKHLIWFPRIRYDKPLTIIGIFTNMAVFPTGTTWNHLEPPGISWNQLEPPGS